jgi:hypothetical protein
MIRIYSELVAHVTETTAASRQYNGIKIAFAMFSSVRFSSLFGALSIECSGTDLSKGQRVKFCNDKLLNDRP